MVIKHQLSVFWVTKDSPFPDIPVPPLYRLPCQTTKNNLYKKQLFFLHGRAPRVGKSCVTPLQLPCDAPGRPCLSDGSMVQCFVACYSPRQFYQSFRPQPHKTNSTTQFTHLQPTHLQSTHLQFTHLQSTHLQPTHLQSTHLQPTIYNTSWKMKVNSLGAAPQQHGRP